MPISERDAESAGIRPVLMDATDHRAHIRRKALEGVQAAFPMKSRNFTVELTNPRVQEESFSSRDQKRAILEARTLHERVVGDILVKDTQGAVVSQAKNFTLMHLPYFTPRHTFIIDGNEYNIANQIRTKPGVYTRKRGNEDLEAAFNLARGDNFRIAMDPEEGVLRLEHKTTKIPLYPVLRALGVPHQDISTQWGSQVADVNKVATEKNTERHVQKLYDKLGYWIQPAGAAPAATHEERVRQLHRYYEMTRMDPDVTKRTLGQAFDHVTPMALLIAAKKLLDVHRNAIDTDDRDSLEFKTFHGVDDSIKERIGLDAKALKTKIGIKLEASRGDMRKAVPASPFTRGVITFLSTSKRAQKPEQINPMELMDQMCKVTPMGEGGISSERAVPMEARQLHPTHFAIMDPSRTPESFKTGIDIRTALATRRDDKGNLYTPLRNVKTGEIEYLRPNEVAEKVVAFPTEKVGNGAPGLPVVHAMKDGEIVDVGPHEVDYQVPHVANLFGPTTNLLPFLNGMQGNRIVMASKHQSQALPLVHREPPHVQVKSWWPGTTVEQEMALKVVPTSPVDGTIERIDDDWIYIRPKATKASSDRDGEWFYNDHVDKYAAADSGLIKLHYDDHFPLAAKTYLHNTIKVRAGEDVKAGQPLAESNFTKNDTLCLGKNMSVGYMAYRGLNSNDGIVVSQGAADKLVSEHMYRIDMRRDNDILNDKELHRTYFGMRYKARQYDNLDSEGVVKPGTKIEPGDPVIVAARKGQITGDAALLGKLSRSLVTPYREEVEDWHHETPGEVIDVVKTPHVISVTVKTWETINVGDKLSGRFGNKGVIAKIVPDAQMVKDEKGNPIDVLFTSAGIISRVNPAQVLEAALGKVAEKTGKPIAIDNFEDRDNVKWVKGLLKEHGLKDKETVYDPITGKSIPGVFVGRSYILKLFKSAYTNWSAHGPEKYDINQQPSRGGDEGAKGIGKMEFDALVAHNARNVLREAASIKSQKNDEFWRAIQLGLPVPSPKTTFAYDKFLTMLEGAGVKVNKDGQRLTLGPMTDADIEKMSSGPVENAYHIKAKNLMPEKGGLFDPVLTGGLTGTKWAHMQLHEPIVNPVFEEPVRRLLSLTQRQFEDFHSQQGGAYFKDALSKIDMDKKIEELKAQSKTLKGPSLDSAVKQIKYLTALKSQGLTPDKAYILSKVPVIPPIMRQIVPLKDGRLLTQPVNLLYTDAFLANKKLQELDEAGLPNTELAPIRMHVYKAVGSVFGTEEPQSPKAKKRNAQGFLMQINGTRPKNGFFQSKIMMRQQDVSGRATIAPDPTLDMDEIGIPEDMLWKMYSKFLIGRLVRKGYPALDAQRMVEEKNPLAREELLIETKERPVVVNRAPTLHRFGVIGAYPKLTSGKTIRLNPFAERGMNADYDGDAIQVHAPVTLKGIEDVKNMTLSKLIFSEKKSDPLNVAPDMEAVIGLHRATQPAGTMASKSFESQGHALAAYHRGEINLSDPIDINKKSEL